MLKVVSPSSTILMAPNYTGDPGDRLLMDGHCHSAPDLPVEAAPAKTTWNASQRQTNQCAILRSGMLKRMTFGPAGTAGHISRHNADPLGLKHWDPTNRRTGFQHRTALACRHRCAVPDRRRFAAASRTCGYAAAICRPDAPSFPTAMSRRFSPIASEKA